MFDLTAVHLTVQRHDQEIKGAVHQARLLLARIHQQLQPLQRRLQMY